MSTPRILMALTCAAALVLVGVGVLQLPRGSSTTGLGAARLSAAQANALLAGSPPVLRALHRQGGVLLEGGAPALHARLATLKGYPVVINKWASWCTPCKQELSAFQRAAADYGRRVAFIGIDSNDSSRSDAAAFLASFPVSYPSYYDRSGRLGEQITYSANTPVTVFIAPDGRQFIHQGQYAEVGKLEQDVVRYALHA